jgi:glyoxylase-like metal-dependent hydrolase (beta-lactamase superfamily II)
MRQLTPRIYGILTLGGYMNGYLVRHNNGLTLVDAGLSGFGASVEKALAALGASWDDITHIFITHAHPDHVGDLANIQTKTNAQTLAHRLETPVVRGEVPVPGPDRKMLPFFSRLMNSMQPSGALPPARVDRALNDDDALDEIGAQVVFLPGHAPGQIGLWLPDEGSLIAGDMVFHYPFFGLSLPLRAATFNWEQTRQTVKKAAQMDIKNLMVGHGQPILGDAGAKLKAFAARLS